MPRRPPGGDAAGRPEQPPSGDRAARAARRAWLRAHHPDAGGDPAAFTEGLRRADWRDRGGPGSPGSPGSPGDPAGRAGAGPEVVFVRRRGALRRAGYLLPALVRRLLPQRPPPRPPRRPRRPV
ncbi:hypothetical protein [Vallicoccus soli]|uniref:hypothetical protein n=1 Tax=Vallicoccus soli TaxID=2339232 RepID=UPI001401ED63|nr:hypothetical protein [Vallicoccus soli]